MDHLVRRGCEESIDQESQGLQEQRTAQGQGVFEKNIDSLSPLLDHINQMQGQLPKQTLGYVTAPNKQPNPMAKSTIFPSHTGKLEFTKKNAGLKHQADTDMKLSFIVRSEAPTINMKGGGMYSSMIIAPGSHQNPSSILNTNGNNGHTLNGFLQQRPPPPQANLVRPVVETQNPSEVDEIISRYRSASYTNPASKSYIPSSGLASYAPPVGTFNGGYSKPFEQIPAYKAPISSFDAGVKSSVVLDSYTTNDFKIRDNVYGLIDPYEKTNGYKSYDTYLPDTKQGSSGATSTNPISPVSTSYNYLGTGVGAYSTSNTFSNPISSTPAPSPFSKKLYTDNIPSAGTNPYTSAYTPPSDHFQLSNSERITNADKLQSDLKETDFQIGKKLGKGQFGDVFLVKHKKTGFVCALKIIKKTTIKEEKVDDQLVREIKIQAYLKHNNVVALYGFFSDYFNVYLLMELCTDGHLFDILKLRRRVEEMQVKGIVRDLCLGLDYIHNERIIHRDVKPQNVILQNGVAKLCDFGWSVFRGTGLRSTYCGTPLYTSPQLIRGEKYDEKIDIWAVGVLTYELLIGKIPFKIYSQDDLNRILQDEITFPTYVDVSSDAKDFILKVLDRSPGGTYYTLDMLLGHPFLKVERSDFTLPDATCI